MRRKGNVLRSRRIRDDAIICSTLLLLAALGLALWGVVLVQQVH